MGTDKAELLLEGKSFLSRIIDSMRDGFDEILVVGREMNPSMEYKNIYLSRRGVFTVQKTAHPERAERVEGSPFMHETLRLRPPKRASAQGEGSETP